MTIKKATPQKQSSPLACVSSIAANHRDNTSKHKRHQIAQVLAHLIEYRSITTLEAFGLYRATRLSAVIHQLRERYGLNIFTEMLNCPDSGARFGRYHLTESGLLNAARVLALLDGQSEKQAGGADA